MVAIERSRSEPGASTFSGSPALIPDLILPVEAGIVGGSTGIDSSHVSDKLCNLWRALVLSSLLCVATQSLVARPRGHVPLHVCGAIFLFLEVRCGCRGVDHGEEGADLGSKKSPLRLLLLNARSQDFGGPLPR